MSRKRSVSSILEDLDDEESPSNQPSSTRRNRSISDLQGTISSQVRQLEIGETSIPASAGRMIDESIKQESEESDNSNQDDVDDEHQDVEFNFLP
ncbi:unnamed protein product [Rhizophagus irregularis]|nr:unnamed protein product [Rhizophagus irregularis]